jgi:cytochrome c
MSRILGTASLLLGALAVAACHGQGSASSAPPAIPEAAKPLLAQLPAAYAHADLDNGRLHFNLCKPCHTLTEGGPNMTGPNLYGVFGRQIASKAGFDYSAALRAKSWTWDTAHLDRWIKNPRADIPGTRMSFYGIPDDEDRRDLIAYLKVASSGGPM